MKGIGSLGKAISDFATSQPAVLPKIAVTWRYVIKKDPDM